MGKKKFCREYVGKQLSALHDSNPEEAAEQLQLPYGVVQELCENLDQHGIIKKEAVKKHWNLISRTPVWKEAEEAYAEAMKKSGAIAEHCHYIPDPASVKEAWKALDGLTEGHLIKAASAIKKQQAEQTKANILAIKKIIVPLLKAYAYQEELNLDICDYQNECSFTATLSGTSSFACDMSDFLARTVFSLAAYIDVCRETDNCMRLELTYAAKE